jgi:hypothetical protein
MPFDGPVKVKPEVAIMDQMIQLLATPDMWVKGVLYDGQRKCLFGAFLATDISRKDLKTQQTIFGTVHKALRVEASKRGFNGAILFNNDPATTHDDLLDFLATVRQSLEAASL